MLKSEPSKYALSFSSSTYDLADSPPSLVQRMNFFAPTSTSRQSWVKQWHPGLSLWGHMTYMAFLNFTCRVTIIFLILFSPVFQQVYAYSQDDLYLKSQEQKLRNAVFMKARPKYLPSHINTYVPIILWVHVSFVLVHTEQNVEQSCFQRWLCLQMEGKETILDSKH